MARLDDIRSIRQALGVSQSRAASLLGVSTGAVQSYEQGLRSVPAYVLRLAALLLYVKWRKQHGKPQFCWQVNRCSPDARAQCPAYQYRAGDFCWMLTGTRCRGVKRQSSMAKLAQCQQCRVMRNWLKY
jgi:transcriptional regulator with XRE-family HTH domain